MSTRAQEPAPPARTPEASAVPSPAAEAPRTAVVPPSPGPRGRLGHSLRRVEVDAAVQRRSDRGVLAAPGERVQDIARAGFRGSGKSLPHQDRIQRSFGRHDVQRIRSFSGEGALDANRRLGSSGYTMGESVAFASPTPDVRLAAHEAAHVVQQRAGLKIPGGLGQEGDRYERHANRVADLVTQGRSAEPLLDEMSRAIGGKDSGSGPQGGHGVQERPGESPQ